MQGNCAMTDINLTLEAFANWVARQDQFEDAGPSDLTYRGPIQTYMFEHGMYQTNFDEHSLYFMYGNLRVYLPTPTWFNHFVELYANPDLRDELKGQMEYVEDDTIEPTWDCVAQIVAVVQKILKEAE